MADGTGGDRAEVAARVFRALDEALGEVLARGGFALNQQAADRDAIHVLYEALPEVAVERVPHVAHLMGDLDAPCIDAWFTVALDGSRIERIGIEGGSLSDLLNAAGLADHAVAYEAAEGFDAQLAACAAAFRALWDG